MRKSEATAPSDKRVIQTLLWALKPLSNLRRATPPQYAVTFLTVALEEGKSSGTYARELGFNRYHMTRYLHSIGGAVGAVLAWSQSSASQEVAPKPKSI
jgi:hypothetical protein